MTPEIDKGLIDGKFSNEIKECEFSKERIFSHLLSSFCITFNLWP